MLATKWLSVQPSTPRAAAARPRQICLSYLGAVIIVIITIIVLVIVIITIVVLIIVIITIGVLIIVINTISVSIFSML